MDWAAFIKEYGLPVTILFLFVGAIVRGYLVPGQTHADVKAQRDRALDLVYLMANGRKAEMDKSTSKTAAGRKGAEDDG